MEEKKKAADAVEMESRTEAKKKDISYEEPVRGKWYLGREVNDAIWNNQVCIHGRICSSFQFSHKVCGESFYRTILESRRLSGQIDHLPVLVSERLMNTKEDYDGQFFDIQGQLRSYDRASQGQKRQLQLSIFAREVWKISEKEGLENQPEQVFLDGFLCRQPVHRATPFGREITELMLAVNRSYGKTDYIPCVCWGRNARYAAGFSLGDQITLWGRIQSRQYTKVMEGEKTVTRTVYEVSVGRLEV